MPNDDAWKAVAGKLLAAWQVRSKFERGGSGVPFEPIENVSMSFFDLGCRCSSEVDVLGVIPMVGSRSNHPGVVLAMLRGDHIALARNYFMTHADAFNGRAEDDPRFEASDETALKAMFDGMTNEDRRLQAEALIKALIGMKKELWSSLSPLPHRADGKLRSVTERTKLVINLFRDSWISAAYRDVPNLTSLLMENYILTADELRANADAISKAALCDGAMTAGLAFVCEQTGDTKQAMTLLRLANEQATKAMKPTRALEFLMREVMLLKQTNKPDEARALLKTLPASADDAATQMALELLRGARANGSGDAHQRSLEAVAGPQVIGPFLARVS